MATMKFKALTHFLIHECRENPRKLGAIRLNKALLKADILAFKIDGNSISGDRYVKRKNGPVPAHILATLNELKEENSIVIREPEMRYEPRLYISTSNPDDEHLSEFERQVARLSLKMVCGMTANEASEETHDVIWDSAQDGEDIPLQAFLASNIGSLSQDVVTWANESISELAH